MENNIMIELEKLSAFEIGKEVNEGKITPTEVLLYFKERIEKYNPVINAITYTKFDEALKEAKKLEEKLRKGEYCGPFAGVPFLLKDFLPSKKGWSNTHGGVKCLSAIDSCNSTFCDAMESLGAIAIGKSNAPSYGFRGATDNKMYGPTHNPYNLNYNAGGSSGGSAASVAMGLVPFAEGGDAGGSIRIPAAFCGLFGFKAGLGTIPMVNRPDGYSATHPFCVNGGLAKSVEDVAILLNQMAKYDPKDPYSIKKEIDYVTEMRRVNPDLKIGFTYDFGLFPVEEEVKCKINEVVNNLKSLHLKVDELTFSFNHTLSEYSEMWCKAITVDCAIELNLLKEKGIDLLTEHKEDFPDEFIYYKKLCDKMGIEDLYEYNLLRTEILDRFEKVFEDYDIIISPVSCVTGVKNSNDNNTIGPKKINGVEVNSLIGWAPTFLVNYVGNPACSIPSGFCANGLPFGFQAISKKYHDEDLLKLAYLYESYYPWKNLPKL